MTLNYTTSGPYQLISYISTTPVPFPVTVLIIARSRPVAADHPGICTFFSFLYFLYFIYFLGTTTVTGLSSTSVVGIVFGSIAGIAIIVGAIAIAVCEWCKKRNCKSVQASIDEEIPADNEGKIAVLIPMPPPPMPPVELPPVEVARYPNDHGRNRDDDDEEEEDEGEIAELVPMPPIPPIQMPRVE